MKKFNYLFMSMLVSFIAFTACGDDDEETPADPTITVTESYSIEGVVSGATGVKVELFKGATSAKNVTTDGAYSFSDLEKVAYTVKATAAGCIDQSVDVALVRKPRRCLILRWSWLLLKPRQWMKWLGKTRKRLLPMMRVTSRRVLLKRQLRFLLLLRLQMRNPFLKMRLSL